ncbi:MAG: proline--tRNA ligase [Dehalococcoidales bacterium]|nr:proline--tRNA ligase [Dehalococcoidales bacterium]MDP6738165.1 proline--tRNA ligase [Dehalococcoidales bacterium]
MRLSKLFGKTQREIPAEADTASHQLMLRAGMIRQVAAGVYVYLPLAWRVLKKIESIIREEIDRVGGQELMLSTLQPFELWQKSGRDQAFGQSLFTLLDRRERKLALGPTHEEVITELVKYNVQSYRDLPLLLYQIQTKFRDEPRPRGGLIRVREFDMMDLYSFDVDETGLGESYHKMLEAYRNIYARCDLPAVMVEADSGAIGGKESHEFMLTTESGEDEIVHCLDCTYAANADKAESNKGMMGGGESLPLFEVSTPGVASIEEVSNFLKVPPSHTLKAVFYVADGRLTFVIIRGDLDVNEVKLKNILGGIDLRMATEAEVTVAGIVPGAASPVLKIDVDDPTRAKANLALWCSRGIQIIADDSVTLGTNFIAGGNKPDVHLKNVNYPRDFVADVVADIARACAGDKCPRCGGKLRSSCGVEVGHIFKLGTFLSEKLGATFVDQSGVSCPIIMGCYGIGVGRLLAAAIEQNHDSKGIIWPSSIAPYQVYLCPIYLENPRVVEIAEKLYADLTAQHLGVLFDDRIESPGVKFNDADLLGIPLRVTISPRTLEKNSVEVKRRSEKASHLIPLDDMFNGLEEFI